MNIAKHTIVTFKDSDKTGVVICEAHDDYDGFVGYYVSINEILTFVELDNIVSTGNIYENYDDEIYDGSSAKVSPDGKLLGLNIVDDQEED